MAAEHLHQGLQVSAVPVLLWEIIQALVIGVKLNSVTSLLRAALQPFIHEAKTTGT